MPRCSRALIGLALTAACVLLAVSARAPLSGGTREINGFRKTGQQNWFTVMGHVGKPQTYILPTSAPLLADFIRFAGDLNETASGQIRIVRNGRVAIRVRFSPTSTEKLIPGDVVIVDGKTSQGRIFRGNKSDAAAGPIQIGLVGIRPWPIVMESEPERATIHWINRQLGQHDSVSQHVKALLPRNFARRDADTRLDDGSVLIFEPAWVDVSRLPADLPQPIDASRPPEPRSAPAATRPPAPLPLPIGPGAASPSTDSPTAVPGHSAIPAPGSITPRPDPQYDRNDEEFTRNILTDPRSVLLEPNRTTAPADPGRTRVSDLPARAQRNPEPSPRIRTEGTAAPIEADVEVIESPPAAKPFPSFIERPAQIQRPGSVPDISDDADSKTGEPGLVAPPDSLTELDPDAEDSDDTDAASGPSLAMQGASSTGLPAPSPAPDDRAPRSPATGDSGPLQPVPATNSDEAAASEFFTTKNWPAIAIVSIGSLGLLAGAIMLLSMMGQAPEPQRPQMQIEKPQPVVHSDRYWLDRIINDEMPIEDEAVDIPGDEALFGRPTRLVRVDEPHATIRKPHFLKRGGESGSVPVTPQTPDLPHPEKSDDDDHGKRPTTYAPERRDRSTMRRPGRPAAPAASAELVDVPAVTVETAHAQETVQTQPTPTFRIDTAHPATHAPAAPKPKKRIPGTRPGRSANAVASAQQTSRDESVLDRILFQVDQGDRS